MRPCGILSAQSAAAVARWGLELASHGHYLPRVQSASDREMPIYAYECNSCGSEHEFIQKFSEGQKRKCPSCGAMRLRKQVTAAAFHLKGSGWYVTDFRDGDKKKAKKEEDGKGSEGETKSTESKSGDGDSKSSDKKSDSQKESKTSGDSKSSGDSKGSKSSDASAS